MKGVGAGERVGNSGVEEEDAVQDLSVAKRDPRKKSLNPSQAQFSAGEFSFCVIGNTVSPSIAKCIRVMAIRQGHT